MKWAAAVVAGCVAACASSSESSSDPGAAACSAWSAAWCGTMQKCAPYWVAANFGTAANCATRQAAVCMAKIKAPDSGLGAAAIEACASAVKTSVECDYYNAIDAVEACRPKPGARKNAAACGDHSQCQSGFCRGLDSGMCGTCATRSKVGAPCTVAADCEFGLSCTATQTIKVCAERAPVGGKCDASHVCLAPAVCMGGSCAAPALAGKPCDTTLKNCDAGLGFYCHDQKAVCTAYKVANEDDACGYFDGDRIACAYGLTCKLTGGGQGECKKIPPDGTGCSAGTPNACLAGAVCDSGVCKVMQPDTCK